MELLERIEQQMAATQLPLFAITVAAVPCPDTPVILTLHWHAFVRERLADVEGAQTVSYKPVPSSALQLNERWEDVLTVDRAAMAAGMGAGRVGCCARGASFVCASRRAVERSAGMSAGLRRVSVRRGRQSSRRVRCTGYRRVGQRRCAPWLSDVDVPSRAWRHLERLRRRCNAAWPTARREPPCPLGLPCRRPQDARARRSIDSVCPRAAGHSAVEIRSAPNRR